VNAIISGVPQPTPTADLTAQIEHFKNLCAKYICHKI